VPALLTIVQLDACDPVVAISAMAGLVPVAGTAVRVTILGAGDDITGSII
jgi:hypothetical protein